MPSFQELGLSENVLNAVKQLGYSAPTPIQEQAIPIVLKGRDLIAAASTGTGKTAAFLLPAVCRLSPSRKGPRPPRILIITPTRELAEQIARTSIKVTRACKQYTTCVFGGKPYSSQIRELRGGTDVLIATPGRLCDLMARGVVELSKIETLILDEADRMLDMGFLPDVKRIVSQTPRERQTLLFSATIDASIRNNLSDLLSDPEIVQIAHRGETARMIDQYVLPIAQKEKAELLKCLLDEKGHDRVIVFARTKARARAIADMLNSAGFSAECIHSDKTQGQRRHALGNFRKGRSGIIVATDVLARGIDIPEVDYVVNYDLPDMAEDYIHRIGRTGRAGNAGFAVSFVSANSLKVLDAIEALLNKEIPIMRMESYDIDISVLRRNRGAKRKRPNNAHHANTAKKNRSKKRTHAKQPAKYNLEGYGDLRKGKKKSKDANAQKKSPKRPGWKSGIKQESARPNKQRNKNKRK